MRTQKKKASSIITCRYDVMFVHFVQKAMKVYQIDIWDKWRITICFGNDDLVSLGELLRTAGEREDWIRNALSVLRKPNTGYTYSDLERRFSVTIISDATSVDQYINTIAHEIKHLQSHICNYYKVQESSEDAAYLVGYLAQQTYLCLKR